MRAVCICGCGRKRGVQRHHVVYKQELRRLANERINGGPPNVGHELILFADPRNLVPLGPKCHAAHHNRTKPLPLLKLPDSVFEFAAEKMGAGRAYEYLKNRYAGSDSRLDALLGEWEASRVAA